MPLDPLRNLVSGRFFPSSKWRRSSATTTRKSRPRLPRLESLEIRSLLSVYMVTNLNDNIDSNAGDGSLRGEIEAAPSNATIEFSPSLAGGTINLDDVAIKLGHNITIDGPAGGITLNANGQSGVLQVSPGVTATLSALTFSGGNATNVASGNGGGILNFGNLSLTDCTVSGNLAHGNGGGIANQGGILSLTGTTFNNDQTYGNGGGLYTDGGTVQVNNSNFTYAFLGGSGGGIYNKGAAVTIAGSQFTLNNAIGNGGAIDNEAGGNLSVSSSSFNDNQGMHGGRSLTRPVQGRRSPAVPSTVISPTIPVASSPMPAP